MPRFRHRRTGREVEVSEVEAVRYRHPRWIPVKESTVTLARIDPTWTVAQVLEWAGDDPERRAQALTAEKAGKKRKGVIEGLS